MRSGFVAGDAALIKPVFALPHLPRQRHEPGGAVASIAAWNDEATWWKTAGSTATSSPSITPILANVLHVALPDAGFYLWAGVRGSDTDFARDLLALYNVTVLPGSFLARDAHGSNPGAQRIRMALVAETAECVEAARRIAVCQIKKLKTPARPLHSLID
jgi:N-succinyldiaminopimelate aminotransferase